MSTMLGKRKRRTAGPIENKRKESSEGSESSELDAQEIFRRHFEAQFEPLPEVAKPTISREESDDGNEDKEEGEWDGISEEEEEEGVQIVHHTNAESRMAAMSKEELKAFMVRYIIFSRFLLMLIQLQSSKPPSSVATKTPLLRDKAGIAIDEEDASESANLKKDLALQRLLAESHLLESSTNPVLTGNNRHKATDLRLQALGSKKSILTQEKMPMSHRKGIIAKKTEKEETRRREARENGIILEKAKMVKKKGEDGRRDRGVGGPGVGKFSGGTLTLSKKDIFDIEGPKRNSTGRGGGSRGGGRGNGSGGRGGGRGRGKR